MMVTVEGSFASGLSPLLETLEEKTSVVDDRVDAYLTLTDRLRNDVKEVLSKEICQKTTNLVSVYQRDMLDNHAELSQASLQALGFCIHHQDISRAFSQKDATSLLKVLCNTLLKTADKCTCTRALWCISKQNFNQDVVKNELHSILCAIEHVLVEGSYQSMAVEHEAINAIIRLLEQLPESMKVHAMRWGNLVYPLLVHSACKIRERAVHAMQLGFPALMSHQPEIVKTLVPELKAFFIQEMVKLFDSRQEIYVLHIWQYFIDLLGEKLHKAGSLINRLLAIVEKGFKSSSPEVRCASFQAWRHLIDNFALDTGILCNHKRLKLLLQPFKVTATKNENIALAKFDAWWHLVQALGVMLNMNFDQVCVPLLQFCLGLSANSLQCPSTPVTNCSLSRLSTPHNHRNVGIRGSPATPQIDLQGTVNSATSQPTYKSLQTKGVEIIAHFLQNADNSAVKQLGIQFTVDPLKHLLISSSSTFTKIGAILIQTVAETFCSIGNELKESLVLYIWQCLSSHMETLLMAGPKKDTVDIFTLYLTSLQSIIHSEKFTPSFTLKLLEIVSNLPQKALTSPSYHVGNAEVMHGTPALYLIQQLFHHSLLDAVHLERYFSIMQRLVECGMNNPTSVLRFTLSVLEMLDKAAVSIDNKEIVWRIWSITVNLLLHHVTQSNEVNQGDSLEHDFSTMYVALTLPVNRIFTYNIAQGTMKTLLKTWSELYRTFARCAALVATAEANVCCEDLSQRILSILDDDALMDMNFVDAVVHLCGVMIHTVDFSVFSNHQQSASGGAFASPAKLNRRGHRPLGNLTSAIHLLCNLLYALYQFTDTRSTSFTGVLTKNSSTVTTQLWSSAVSGMMTILSTLFTHISMATMIADVLGKLAEPIANVFVASVVPVSFGGLFTPGLNQKLEKLLTDILTAVESRYKGPYNTAMLSVMSPLFEATLHHPKRAIKNRSLVCWNATFAGAVTLEYPKGLKLCLQKLREKTPIILPGFKEEDIEMLEEPSFSLANDSEASQLMAPPAPVPPGIPVLGRPSPQKMHGSFLGKTVAVSVASPKRTASPLRGSKQSKGFTSPQNATVRRKLPLSIDEDSKVEFVKIAPSPKKKRVLTEHQKEVLRSRTVVPAMYNDLDASQDTNLMAELLASQSVQETPTLSDEDTSSKSSDPEQDENDREKTNIVPSVTSANKDNAESSFDKKEGGIQVEEAKSDGKRVSFCGLIERTKTKDEKEKLPDGTDSGTNKHVNVFELFSDVRDYDDKNNDRNDSETLTRSDPGMSMRNDAAKQNKSEKIERDEISKGQPEAKVKNLDIVSESKWLKTPKERKDEEKLDNGIRETVEPDSVEDMDISSEEQAFELDVRKERDGTVELNTTNEDMIAGTPPKENSAAANSKRRSLGVLIRTNAVEENGKHTSENFVEVDLEVESKVTDRADNSSEVKSPVTSFVPETQSLDLFADSASDLQSNSEIIAVADSQAETKPVKGNLIMLSAPVLKLKRLSEDEIKRYSPKKNKKYTKSSSPCKKGEEYDDKADGKESHCSVGRKPKRRRSIIGNSPQEKNVVADPDLDAEAMEGVTPLPADKDDDGDSSVTECGKTGDLGNKNTASRESDEGTESKVESQELDGDVFSQELSPVKKKLGRKHKKAESSQELTKDVITPKRKVGRPPKKRRFSAGDAANMRKTESQEYGADISSQELLSPLMKKKRGRKPKHKTAVTSPHSGTESCEEPMREPTPKRKRGRPAKLQNTPLSTIEEVTESSRDSSTNQRPVRRRVSKYCRQSQDRDQEVSNNSDRDVLTEDDSKDEVNNLYNSSMESVDLFASQKDTEEEQKCETDEAHATDNKAPESDVHQGTNCEESDKPQKTSVVCSPVEVNSGKEGVEESDTDTDDRKDADHQGDDPESVNEPVMIDSEGKDVVVQEIYDDKVEGVIPETDADSEVIPKVSDDAKTAEADAEASPRFSGRKKRLVGRKKRSPNQEAAKRVLLRIVKSPNRSPMVTRSKSPMITRRRTLGSSPIARRKMVTMSPVARKQLSPKDGLTVKKSKTGKSGSLHSPVHEQNGEEETDVKDDSEKDEETEDEEANENVEGKEDTASDGQINCQEENDDKDTASSEKIIEQEEDSSDECAREVILNSEQMDDIDREKNDSDDDDWDLPLASLVGKENKEEERDTDIKTVVENSEPKSKLDEGNTAIEHEVERIDSSQSPPRSTAKASTLPYKDTAFSSPRSSPVSSRRFVFPKLSNLSPSSSPSSREKQSDLGSPQGRVTSPAHLRLTREVLSPKMSPSGGILKRKCTDSPSPPNKLRRVSFAEPLEQDESENCNSPEQKVVNRCLELNKSALSPLVTDTPSKVITSQSKYITTPLRESSYGKTVNSGYRSSPISGQQQDKNGFITPTSTNRKRRISKLSQGSSQASSQEEEWDSQDQVYPELNDCKSPVDQVLPQLTSSIWSRGLGQLVRARNIHTVGNLCSLTCGEVQNLPIRSPKVQTIKTVMGKFEKQLRKNSKNTKSSIQAPATIENGSKGTDEDNKKEKEVAALLEDSSQLLEEINKLSQTDSSNVSESCETVHQGSEQRNDSNKGSELPEKEKCGQEENVHNDDKCESQEQENAAAADVSDETQIEIMEPDCPSSPKKPRLMERLGNLTDEITEEHLRQLSSEEIFQAHQQVNGLLSMIVGALKSKCK